MDGVHRYTGVFPFWTGIMAKNGKLTVFKWTAAAFLAAVVSACGNKGELYRPDTDTSTATTASSAQQQSQQTLTRSAP